MEEVISKYLDLIESIYGVPYYECIIKYKGKVIYRYSSEKLRKSGKDMYFAYSITKPVTCVGALRLVEQGRIKLDDKVCKYLPEYEKMLVLKDGRCAQATRQITIEDLFSMCAGLNYNVRTESILAKINENPEATTRDIARAIADEPLDFEPGERFQYSLCHDVLASVVEEVSGMRFNEYQDKNIFGPLGMEDTAYGFRGLNHERMVPQLNYTYEQGLKPMKMENMYFLTSEFESGGAGLVTTAEDYIKFAGAMSNNGVADTGYRLLAGKTIEDMKRNRIMPEMVDEGYRRKYMQGYGYGLGVRTMIAPNILCSASPVGEFGWSGAGGAYTLMDTENNLAVIYMQHVYSMVRIAEEVHPMIRELSYKFIKEQGV